MQSRWSHITVLYIEDNIFHREEVTRALAAGLSDDVSFEVTTVATFQDA